MISDLGLHCLPRPIYLKNMIITVVSILYPLKLMHIGNSKASFLCVFLETDLVLHPSAIFYLL